MYNLRQVRLLLRLIHGCPVRFLFFAYQRDDGHLFPGVTLNMPDRFQGVLLVRLLS